MRLNRTCHDFLTKVVNTLKHKLDDENFEILDRELFRNRDLNLCDWLNVSTLKRLIDKSPNKNKMREFIKLCLQKVVESGFWEIKAKEKAREVLDSLFGRCFIKINVRYKGVEIPCRISIRSSIETSKEIVNASGYSPFRVVLDGGEYFLSVVAETEDGAIEKHLEFSTDEKEWNVELDENDITKWKVTKVQINVEPDSFPFNTLKESALVVVSDKFGRKIKVGETDENGVVRFQKSDLNLKELELRVYPQVGKISSILEKSDFTKGERYSIEIESEKLDPLQPVKTVTIKVKKEKERYKLRTKFDETKVSQQAKIVLLETIQRLDFKRIGVRVSEWLAENKPEVLPYVKNFAYSSLGSDHLLHSHQLKALNALCEGKDVLVCAPNGSGKTEIPLLYTLKKLLNMDGRITPLILAIYPTKALTKDQENRWKKLLIAAYDLGLLNNPVAVTRIDGDTMRDPSAKEYLKRVNEQRLPLVALSNPSFILSVLQQGSWKYYFGSRVLLLIVIDEIHFYSSRDLTLLIKMLEHIIRYEDTEDLRLAFLSATIGSPEEFKRSLENALEREIRLIRPEYEGESGNKKYVWTVRVSDENEAEKFLTEYFKELLERESDIEKTIVFVPNRNIAERLAKNLSHKANSWTLIQCHLGDMSYEEREEVEENFAKGLTRVLFTVKTLEVGINIGDVRRVIHFGVPQSLNDFVQREGRAGRRGGDSESIIITTNTAEEKRAKNFVEQIKDLENLTEYMYKPVIKMDSEFMRLIDQQISKRFPRSIKLPNGWELRVGFYSQDKTTFLAKGAKIPKEIRKQDVIYRYLPGSIRVIKGRDYIVSDVKIGKSSNVIKLSDLNYYTLLDTWQISSYSSGWNLVDQVKSGMVFTVSDVNRSFETPIGLDDFLDVANRPRIIKIVEVPEGVKLIQKYEKEVYDDEVGRFVKKIVFRSIGTRELNQNLKENLKFELISRGYLVTLRISRDSALLGVIRRELSSVYQDLSGEFKIWWPKRILEEYTHLATHFILNMISEIHQWRQDEIQHSIRVSIKDEIRLMNLLHEIINLKRRLDLPIEVQIAFINEVDLVQDVDWVKIHNKISEIKQQVKDTKPSSELEELCKDIVANCYGFRCFETPYTLEVLLSSIESSKREDRTRLLLELKDSIIAILTIAENILQKIIGMEV